MAIKELYQIKLSGGTDGHEKVLRNKSQTVNKVDEKILEIINNLRDTLWAYPFCIGLSAPQIGESYAISIINVEKRNRNDDLILINPHIIEYSGKKDKKRESCMSVWGKSGEVERRDKIVIKYQDMNLNYQTKSFAGFMSRAVQHEIDHLNGILYSDKLVENRELQIADIFNNYNIIK